MATDQKRAQIAVYDAWRKLHDATICVMKKAGVADPDQRLRPLSMLFPNQAEALNRPATRWLEGLDPLFATMTADKLAELYGEIETVGHNRLNIADLMTWWGRAWAGVITSSIYVFGGEDLLQTYAQGSHFQGATCLLDVDPKIHAARIYETGTTPHAFVAVGPHGGFFDYPEFAMIAGVLRFNIWQSFKRFNFQPMPVLGSVLMEGNGIPADGHQQILSEFGRSLARGVGPVIYPWGSNMLTGTRDPYWDVTDAFGEVASLFAPRDIRVASAATSGIEAARAHGVPLVSFHRYNADRQEPMIGLSKEVGRNAALNFSLSGAAFLHHPLAVSPSPALAPQAIPTHRYQQAATFTALNELGALRMYAAQPVRIFTAQRALTPVAAAGRGVVRPGVRPVPGNRTFRLAR